MVRSAFRAIRPVGRRAISGPASGVGTSRTEDGLLATQVVLMGLGAIGRLIARAVLTRSDLEIVAAVDLDAQRVGRKLSDVVDAPAPDVIITSDAAAALKQAQHGVLLHATGSRLDRVEGELAQALSAGVAVVSTCEELSYPWLRNPEIAERLDKIAERRKVALLGTGVNPGFVLDRLPATLGNVVGRVDRVQARRVVAARTPRVPVQAGSGARGHQADCPRAG